MAERRIALVTGANKGIGYEIARGLCVEGASVFLGCRDEERGERAEQTLRSQGFDAEAVLLDVTNAATIEATAFYIDALYGRLDILVNNAGVWLEGAAGPKVVDPEIVKRMFDVNVFGAIAVTEAMLPLLKKSPAGRIVSTRLASLEEASRLEPVPNRPIPLGYGSSKTALNAATLWFAKALADTPIKVNAVSPGLCATDMTRGRGRPAREGAAAPLRLALVGDDGPTGGFFDDEGEIPW